VNIKGLGSLRHNPALNLTASTGFISSRQALSILPRERTPPSPNPRKRKINSISSTNPSKSKQTTIKSYMDPILDIPHEKPAKIKKLPSSGIIQDRGRLVTVKTELPSIQQMSSPHRGCDVDELPFVSFSSSPLKELNAKSPSREGFSSPPLINSPTNPANRNLEELSGFVLRKMNAPKKSLGIRRDMKPWPSKRGLD
jgi:hypothetical protein